MNNQLKQDLAAATDGLLYPSETDAPFELVELSPPFPWQTKEPSEVIGVRQFFGELLEGPDAAQFKALWEVLAGSLADLTIRRVGEINIDIYITGREADKTDSANENRVGIKTHAVET